jgi:hypothetical protein
VPKGSAILLFAPLGLWMTMPGNDRHFGMEQQGLLRGEAPVGGEALFAVFRAELTKRGKLRGGVASADAGG